MINDLQVEKLNQEQQEKEISKASLDFAQLVKGKLLSVSKGHFLPKPTFSWGG